MGPMRRQIDDDFGIAVAQKTLEVGVVRARAKALLSGAGPLFKSVTSNDPTISPESLMSFAVVLMKNGPTFICGSCTEETPLYTKATD